MPVLAGRSRALPALPVVLAIAWVLAAAAPASAAQLPWVTISPLGGTKDATPTTQISFLGVRSGEISQIVVHGSASPTPPEPGPATCPIAPSRSVSR
jgi:hypothetical protein